MRKRARKTQPHTFELHLIRFSKTSKSTFQTRLRMIEPLKIVRIEIVRIPEERTVLKSIHVVDRTFDAMQEDLAHTCAERIERFQKLKTARTDRFGCSCWGRSAHVGDHVGDRGIRLVPDARDDRHRALRYETCERLIIERHEVFEGSTTAHEQHLFSSRTNNRLKPRDKIGSSMLPFYRNAREEYLHKRIATAQRAQDIMHSSSTRRGDKTDRRRIRDHASFTRRIHQAFVLQHERPFSNLCTQIAFTSELERRHIEIHTPLWREYRELAHHFNTCT